MTTYFVLAYFRECAGAGLESEVIKVCANSLSEAETRVKQGYRTCVSAMATQYLSPTNEKVWIE